MDVDLKIDSTTWDLIFDGDTIDCVAGLELVTQRVLIGLKTFAEEELLVVLEESGTDWWNTAFTDRPKTNLIEAMLRKRILDDEDIERIDSFTMTVDARLRSLTVSFVAISTYGPVVASTVLP